ncbi:MAG TPA: hypothetical protein VFN67_42675 [Polyangiales bacterium]|nr:hypothetical protein [Polyangiales bacterium]
MLTINRQNLKNSHQFSWFLLDFLMLGLLFVSLGLLIFDSTYSFLAVQKLMARHVPALNDLYRPIHEHFLFVDAVFVAIFLGEFCVRWGHSIKARIYDRWYFYPFIHWYDLIGCIPIGSLRFLRTLRVVSIIYRLHQHRIIDLNQWRVYQLGSFYLEAFLEELSDLIVIKVISGVQEEVKRGSPLFDRIQHDILLPRRSMISDWLSSRIARASQQGYVPNRDALRRYLEMRVANALKQNHELARLRDLPLVGPTLHQTLERSVGDIVASVMHQILIDLSSVSNHAFVEDLVGAFLAAGPEGDTAVEARNDALIQLIVEVLEAVKGQVGIKRWRENLP